jgi:FkbH-like protein
VVNLDIGRRQMSGILEHARKLDPFALSSIEIHKLSREVRKADIVRDARISFTGNIVFEPLPEFLEAHLACHGTLASSHVAPFGQVLQEVLNPASGLRQFDPNFVLLHLELDSLLPGLLDRRVDTEHGWHSCVDEVLGAVVPLVRAALNSTQAIVLLTNFVGPDCYDLGLADSRAEFGEQEFFSQLNSALGKAFRAEPRVQIVDLCRLMALHGRARARDRRLYYVAKIPWHESFLPLLADELVRHINTGLGRIRKCLVLDLDNTLWGGVLGEDGPMGVHVGMDDPVAEAHFDLQRRILAIKRRGVLLAVCSKNNPADVEEVFRLRPEMPLRKDDFVCMEVGWEMKHEGLQRIAKQLNIGTDSLVFLDDNPAEIELIRQVMPEVECVLVPADAALRPACLNRVHSLDRAVITAEDLQKTRQYRDNAGRETARQEFADLHDYLHSLQTRIRIVTAAPDQLPRVHQLFSKTNQFNVTTKRYSLVELQAVAADADSLLLVVHAEDRFGDFGWIGAALLRGMSQSVVHIDSFILSCRAMGRAIESAVLNEIKQRCFARAACLALTAEYVPTAKNIPVRELYEEHGFAVVSVDASLHKHYRLDRGSSSLSACDWIACEASTNRE